MIFKYDILQFPEDPGGDDIIEGSTIIACKFHYFLVDNKWDTR